MVLPGSRIINGVGLLFALSSMLFAAGFLQYYLGLEPCALCIVDRVLVCSLGVLFLLALIHNPGLLGQRVYGIFSALVALTGIAVCWRHIWLQNLPKDLVPSCGPGLDYMLDTLPFAETLQIIFTASGECADIQWRFLGLTLPEQTFLVFIGFFGLALTQIFRKRA